MIGKFHLPVSAGGSLPDPAVFCPINGYYDPTLPIPYIKDTAIPTITPDDGSIVLFMTSAWDNAFNIQCSNSLSQKTRYTVYGAGDAVLYTVDQNNNTTLFYQFTSTGGILMDSGLYLFKVVMKPATTGVLTAMSFQTKSTYAPNGWPVLEAHIKAPGLLNLNSSFQSQKYLKFAKFYANHNSLTSLSSTFYDCISFVECHMDVQMNALVSLSSTFRNTPALEMLTLPTTLPLLGSLSLTFYNCGLKSSPQLPLILPECTTATQSFSSMQRLSGTLIIPDMPKCLDVTYMVSYLPLVTKITFLGGPIPNTGAGMSLAWSNPNLVEIDMGPTRWGKSGVAWTLAYLFDTITSLRKLTLPPQFIGMSTPNAMQLVYNGINYGITEINTVDWSQCAAFSMCPNLGALIRFDQPTLKVLTLTFNGSSLRYNALEYLEIDWINSPFQSAGINISYCSFPAAELNRIFTALPVTGTAKTITCSNNPGYATCDKTIATAKGWTVI